MKSEVWKDIKGFEGWYQVSSFGNVRRIAPRKRKCAVQKFKTVGEYERIYLCNAKCPLQKDGISFA